MHGRQTSKEQGCTAPCVLARAPAGQQVPDRQPAARLPAHLVACKPLPPHSLFLRLVRIASFNRICKPPPAHLVACKPQGHAQRVVGKGGRVALVQPSQAPLCSAKARTCSGVPEQWCAWRAGPARKGEAQVHATHAISRDHAEPLGQAPTGTHRIPVCPDTTPASVLRTIAR